MPSDYAARYGMDYLPMLWNSTLDPASIESRLRDNPAVKDLLVLNEPN
ncbi:hypothetical protein [Deinococcus apachensis]|nr:hypothetical protein [Deinococcus apachensis]